MLNAKGITVPVLLVHGKQDSLIPIEQSREIYNNLENCIYKKLIEVEGDHNDCRDNRDINTIRDFILQFSYDSFILKEHRRRLRIKNAHLAHFEKYGLNINSIIKNFKLNMKEEIKKEKFVLNNLNLKKGSKRRSRSLLFTNYNTNERVKKRSSSNGNRRIKLDTEKSNKITLTENNRDSLFNDVLNYGFCEKSKNNKTTLRSDRNYMISSMVNPNLRIRSSMVVITHLDKTAKFK
jgi:hypothetical protein